MNVRSRTSACTRSFVGSIKQIQPPFAVSWSADWLASDADETMANGHDLLWLPADIDFFFFLKEQ